jgi:hypothetical protein
VRLRTRVVPQGPPAREQAATEAAVVAECEVERVQDRSHRISWARLLKRVLDLDVQHGPRCGAGPVKIIAAILEREVIGKILTRLGLDPQPPPSGKAREAGHEFAARVAGAHAGTRHRASHVLAGLGRDDRRTAPARHRSPFECIRRGL